MTTPAPQPPQCRAPWPQDGRVHCTRPKDHAGGHLDEPGGRYWPADEAIAVQAAIGSRCTSCSQKRVNCRCAS